MIFFSIINKSNNNSESHRPLGRCDSHKKGQGEVIKLKDLVSDDDENNWMLTGKINLKNYFSNFLSLVKNIVKVEYHDGLRYVKNLEVNLNQSIHYKQELKSLTTNLNTYNDLAVCLDYFKEYPVLKNTELRQDQLEEQRKKVELKSITESMKSIMGLRNSSLNKDNQRTAIQSYYLNEKLNNSLILNNN